MFSGFSKGAQPDVAIWGGTRKGPLTKDHEGDLRERAETGYWRTGNGKQDWRLEIAFLDFLELVTGEGLPFAP